jgi:hypothetical protein
MKAAKPATCCNASSCDNNRSRRTTLACSHCGKCGDCTFHSGCETASGGLTSPVVAACSSDDCINSTNNVQLLACITCGRCGDCSTHSH